MLMWSNEFEPPTFHLLTLYQNIMGKCSRKKDPPSMFAFCLQLIVYLTDFTKEQVNCTILNYKWFQSFKVGSSKTVKHILSPA